MQIKLWSFSVLNRIALESVVILCVGTFASAQIIPGEATDSGLGGSNSVQGIVLGPNGDRVSRRIRVRLITETRGGRTTMTDDTGNFSFQGLTGGGYSIVIDKEKEFEPFTTSFDIFQLRGSPPQTYMLNIRLVMKKVDIPKLAVVDAALAGVPDKALAYFRKAKELSAKQDYGRSVEQMKLAIEEYPGFSIAQNDLGVLYLRLGEAGNAEQAFRAALDIDPGSLDALTNLGIVLVRKESYADAVPVLRKVVEKDGQSAVGHYFLGQALANLGKFDEAAKELVFSLELGGDRMNEAHRILAIIYSSRNEKGLAAAELETYLRINPKVADSAQLRQVILKLKGENP